MLTQCCFVAQGITRQASQLASSAMRGLQVPKNPARQFHRDTTFLIKYMSLGYNICVQGNVWQNTTFKVTTSAKNNSPCFLVAEFLGNNLPQLEPQAVSYFLRQVRMWATAEYFDVRHFVAIQGVFQLKGAAAASCCRVWGGEESETTTGNESTVDELRLAS